MATQEIITVMTKLHSLHESLLTISKEKTVHLKSGDTTAFQATFVNERKHVQAIGQLEDKRQALTKQWFTQQGVQDANQTVSEMLSLISDSNEKEQLMKVYEQLVITIAELKQQEQLNRELTEQSLQFVELSLELLQPSIKNMNYGEKKQGEQAFNRSMFDSKA
ncbi:flagellar biosynthesis/type III secretory pathway chaperone [Salirhabdus euzebyi]|uniref:Flagellar biosynthesis/type III secretory pathway chaperone n=1 Tax=Salirhabdus euzebyi TaxID=394506 RepID=A0A841Q5G5_9BACI|nr:flagellar protein FlgN [Salirhabdus euzebyi]MBB6453630.1 flagellar biosynthesis/type III secretory pathway chaperone [Salirhabdus euzebyi]